MRTRLRNILPAIGAAIIAAIAAVSCNTSGCTDNRSSIPLAEFYSSATGERISLDSLEITGVGAPDSAILLVPGTSADQIHLPMRASADNTQWCLRYCWRNLDYPQLNDTISLSYEALPYFAGDECGAMYRYRLRSVRHTTHLIDSIGVIDSLITNIDTPDLNIYFRTGDTPGGEEAAGTPLRSVTHKPSQR